MSFGGDGQDIDNRDDPTENDGVECDWTVTKPDSESVYKGKTKANEFCHHDDYGYEMSYTFEDQGTYSVTAATDDCAYCYDDEPVSPSPQFMVHVMGGPIEQVNPAPPATARVHTTCVEPETFAGFEAAPNQPPETYYWWKFSNNLGLFKIGETTYTRELKDSDRTSVTVTADIQPDAETHDVELELLYRHIPGEYIEVTCPCAPNPPEKKAFESMTSAGITVASQTDPYPIPQGWEMITTLQARDQCAHVFDTKLQVAEYRREPWCRDQDLPFPHPVTIAPHTDWDGMWPDYTWWSGDFPPSGWCGKADQRWRAGGCGKSDIWFCQQWYPDTVAQTQKPACEICASCTEE